MRVPLRDSNGVPLRDSNDQPLMCERVPPDDEPPERREDGPTLEEYVAAGYLPANYPPGGYAEQASPALDHYRATGAMPLAEVVEPVELPASKTKRK